MGDNDDIQETAAYKYAIKLLAPRDYSRYKLKEKLLSRDFERDSLDPILDLLEEKQYLDESRYAKAKIKAYIFRNKGPVYIEQKLNLEKIQNIKQYIEEVETENEVDWTELASSLVKKYSRGKPLDYKERGKVYGKLASKGFSLDIINQVLN